MKVIKPQLLALSFRPFLWRKPRLCVTHLIGFTLGGQRSEILSEQALWPLLVEGTGGVFDEGLPKPQGEVLCFGPCFAPHQQPTIATHARIAIGPVDKAIVVVGDRYWEGMHCSAPVPFLSMPLGWDRAWGGKGHPQNPVGRGRSPVVGEDQVARIPLPNLEHPRHRIESRADRPPPIAFGPLDAAWPVRTARAGSYGPGYLENHFPGFPPDVHPEYFQMAAPDQRLPGFFLGTEEYVVENLHPSRPRIAGKLPGVAARAFVHRAPTGQFDEVPMRLETVILLPAAQTGVLVFRGTTEVAETDAADIDLLLAAFEERESPRSLDHYRAALEIRADKDQGPLVALNEADLLPAFAKNNEIASLIEEAQAQAIQSSTRQLERIQETIRQELEAAGLPEGEILAILAKATQEVPPLPDFGDPESLAAFERKMEALQRQAQARHEESTRLLQATMAEAGVSAEGKAPSGPPAKNAETVLAEFRAAEANCLELGIPIPPNLAQALGDATLRERLEAADQAALASYRAAAHLQPAPARLAGHEQESRRQRVLAAHAAKQPLDDQDLTGVDLSSTDLPGISLRQSFLAGANLARADLSGGQLGGVLLAHADLTGARFAGVEAVEANFGAALLAETCFDQANLTRANFWGATLQSVSFQGATLQESTLLEAQWGEVDFTGADATGLSFLKCDLTRARFAKTKLNKSNFIELSLDRVCFQEADLELSSWITVGANEADFGRAHLKAFQAVMGCSFRQANFAGANLTGAFLRGADFTGANFAGAILDEADFSECNLEGAILTGVSAKHALFTRARLTGVRARQGNFMHALLTKATLHAADFSRTNLHGADLGGILLDDRTNLREALMDRALLHPLAKEG
jgi:uncharacterized protein YjbI with pentapeptide repeats